MNETRAGILIALEGIDGCGKSTQAALLGDALRARGHSVTVLREPGDTEPGRTLRRIFVEGRDVTPEEEMQLFLADRKIDVRDNILPALGAGHVVVMDRYYLSSIVYQGALGLDPERIRRLNEEIAPAPALTVVLDVPPATGRGRIRRVRGATNTFEGHDYLEEVRRRYLATCDDGEVVCLDAGDSVDDVHARLLEVVLRVVEAVAEPAPDGVDDGG